MGLVDNNSLAVTLNNINLALLKNESLSKTHRDETASWIASRVDIKGSYRGLPSPTGKDYHNKLILFTGETVGSHAGTGCKLGFEATWALGILRPTNSAVVRAAKDCQARAIERFAQETSRRQGMYCCYSCTNAGWRALGASPGGKAGKFLDAGMSVLRSLRDGKGRWEKFPFWYTILSLSDLDRKTALEELQYAAPALERSLRGKAAGIVDQRRCLLAKWVLDRI